MPADNDKGSAAAAVAYQNQEGKNFQWKSPLLSMSTLLPAGADATLDDKGEEMTLDWQSPQSATVPEAGWYGLCFAKDTQLASVNSGSDDEDDDDSDIQNIVVEGSDEERNIRRAEKAGKEIYKIKTQHDDDPLLAAKNTALKPILKKKKYNRKNRPSNWKDGQPPQTNAKNRTQNASTTTDPLQNSYIYTYYLALQWPQTRPSIESNPVTNDHKQQQSSSVTRKVITLNPQPMREIVLYEIAVDVGWLHYFPQGCSVALVRKQKKGVTETKKVVTGIRDDDDTLQWFLMYRRWVSKAISAASKCSKTSASAPDNPSSLNNNNDNIVPTPPPGTVAAVKKAIVCAQCSKRFATPRAAIGHRDQVHAIPEEEKVPIEGATRTSQRVQLPSKLDILYEDNFVAAIDKPQGVAVMGDKTTLYRSDLFMQLAVPPEKREVCVQVEGSEPQQQQQQQQSDEKIDTVNKQTTPKYKYKYKNKPVPVHRLDAATGGILMIAKTKEAEASLKMSFHDRKCHKKYRALLIGRLEQPAPSLEDGGGAWVEEDVSGKPSRTRYCVVSHHPCAYVKDGWVTVVDLFPETGRKHQLRKHMKSLGYSIWGDRRYGGTIQSDRTASTDAARKGEQQDATPSGATEEETTEDKLSHLMSRLCLWAVELSFPHPHTNKVMSVKIKEESPEWLRHVIQEVAKQEKS